MRQKNLNTKTHIIVLEDNMDIDKLIEDLETNGVSKDGIAKILDIITGKNETREVSSEKDLISNVELALLNEVDPIRKVKLAAKIISMRLEE